MVNSVLILPSAQATADPDRVNVKLSEAFMRKNGWSSVLRRETACVVKCMFSSYPVRAADTGSRY